MELRNKYRNIILQYEERVDEMRTWETEDVYWRDSKRYFNVTEQEEK